MADMSCELAAWCMALRGGRLGQGGESALEAGSPCFGGGWSGGCGRMRFSGVWAPGIRGGGKQTSKQATRPQLPSPMAAGGGVHSVLNMAAVPGHPGQDAAPAPHVQLQSRGEACVKSTGSQCLGSSITLFESQGAGRRPGQGRRWAWGFPAGQQRLLRRRRKAAVCGCPVRAGRTTDHYADILSPTLLPCRPLSRTTGRVFRAAQQSRKGACKHGWIVYSDL